MYEYETPFDRFGDSEDRYARDQEAEQREHEDQVIRERLYEHRSFRGPDPKPVRSVKRREQPKPDENWKLAVLDRDQGCCICADPATCEPPFQAHHVAYVQLLRRARLEQHMWDVRVGMGVCSKAHRQHHNRARPIFMDEIPLEVKGFLEELGLGWWLSKRYPERQEAAA